MRADKEWFEIIMKQANGKLMTVLENQIQADIGVTREQANRVANHILDILDNVKENREQEIRTKTIDEFAERLKVKAEKILKNPDIAADCKKCTIWKVRDIYEIAEMLKAGGKNE